MAPDRQTYPSGKPIQCTQEASTSAECSGALPALCPCCPMGDCSQQRPMQAPQVTPSHSCRAHAWERPGTFIPNFFPWSLMLRCFPHTLSIWKQFLCEDSLQKERHTHPHFCPAQLSDATYSSRQAEKRPFSWQEVFLNATLPEDKIISGQTTPTWLRSSALPEILSPWLHLVRRLQGFTCGLPAITNISLWRRINSWHLPILSHAGHQTSQRWQLAS